jgi:hypothetical protein
MPLAGTFAFP